MAGFFIDIAKQDLLIYENKRGIAMLINSGKTETTRGKELCYAFHEVNGELYVVLGPDGALEVADVKEDWGENTKSASVFKLTLKGGITPEQASTPQNAKEVATNAFIDGHINKKTVYSNIILGEYNIATALRDEAKYAFVLNVNIWHDLKTSDIQAIQRVANLPHPSP